MKSSVNVSRYTTVLAIVTVVLLLIPIIAMQFTDQVLWTLGDFIFAGTLIFGTGLTYKLITRTSGNLAYRLAVGIGLASGFLLIWGNAAVGIIGSETNPINLAYNGLVLVGFIAAIFARFEAPKMVVTLFYIAGGQALIAAIAIMGGYYQSPPSSVLQILGANGLFVALWIFSALLFRYAGQQQTNNTE